MKKTFQYIRKDNYSFLDKLSSYVDKSAFIEKFCEFTKFPNIREVSEKIDRTFKDCLSNISRNLNGYGYDTTYTVVDSGYDPTCSVGLKKALPGSDLDKGYIILQGNGYNDEEVVNKFKGELWNNLDQRIVSLNHPDTFPAVYTKKQVKEIEYVLKGNVIVKRVPKSFYLDMDSNSTGRSDYVQAGLIENEKSITKHIGRILKVVGMIGISILMATLTVNDFMKGDDLQAWFNLLSRIMAAIGGFYSGCRNSYRVNEIDIRAIRLKRTLLNEYCTFITDKPDYFKVTDEEYDAEEEYEKTLLENKSSNSVQQINPVIIEQINQQ